ncbi:hypothetical protein EK904_008681, partial [Melospiza melodia maxima]
MAAAPYHPGDPVPGWIISKDRSHEDGLNYFHRTGQLDQSLSVCLLLPDEDLVRVPTGYLRPLYHDWPTQVLLVGDNKHTPYEITVIPEVITVDPFNEITVTISCTTPPYTLCKHSPFAQMYILPGQDPDSTNYNVYFSQTLSRERPNIQAIISWKDKCIDLILMADMDLTSPSSLEQSAPRLGVGAP